MGSADGADRAVQRGRSSLPDVYIHPKILDAYGEGMSKSKGTASSGRRDGEVRRRFAALRAGRSDHETQDIRMPVDFECPHCRTMVEQTRENRIFAAGGLPTLQNNHFSTQWADKPADTALPRVRGQRPLREGPQFLQQTVECLAFRLDEPPRHICRRR